MPELRSNSEKLASEAQLAASCDCCDQQAPGQQRHAPGRVTYQDCCPANGVLHQAYCASADPASEPRRCQLRSPSPRTRIGEVRDEADAEADMPLAEASRRNMRSKIRWFTEFCNSHYVSHFAAFFIVTGAKISVVESCLWFSKAALKRHSLIASVSVDVGERWPARPSCPAPACKMTDRPTGRPSHRPMTRGHAHAGSSSEGDQAGQTM